MIFTPKQQEALELAQSEKYNFILYGGAVRGGKTIWGLCTLLILCELFPKSRWAVIRQNSERIRKTTIPSFSKLESNGSLRQSPYEYTHHNKSTILFIGENYDRDKDLDAFKGLEVNGFLFEEINECQLKTFYKAMERAGTWIIPGSDIQPKPIILATCNPTYGWLKELVYDKWKNDELPDNWAYVQAKITDNPYLPDAYIENLKSLPRYEYEVFVEGNWDIQLKTGGEFWKDFELNKHVKPLSIEETTIHISVDNNVYPYISISLWQIIQGEITDINQIHEIPCKDPYNTASKAGHEVVKYLLGIDYKDVVFIYGDKTSGARNTIDDDKKSFLDKFCESIEKHFSIQKRFPQSNPPVALSGEFVNAIYEKEYDNLRINIDEGCKTSISDYIETKQASDGSMLKTRVKDSATGITYEKNGHFSDTKRYFVCEAFKNSFIKFKKRFDPTEKNYSLGQQITNRRF